MLDELTHLGIDYDDVVGTLEDDGIAKFENAWTDLAHELQAALTDTRTGSAKENS